MKKLICTQILQLIKGNIIIDACIIRVIEFNIIIIYIMIFEKKYTYNNIIYLLYDWYSIFDVL